MNSSNTRLCTNATNNVLSYIIILWYNIIAKALYIVWSYTEPITNKNNNLYLCYLFVHSLRTRRLDKVDHGWVRSDLTKAFQVWSKYSKLTFREVNSESADILVFFEKWVLGPVSTYCLNAYTLCSTTECCTDTHFWNKAGWYLKNIIYFFKF